MASQIVLQSNETIVQEFSISQRLFWSLIIVGIALLAVIPVVGSILISLITPVTTPVLLSLVVAGFILGFGLLIYAFYLRQARHYILTNERVVATRGFPVAMPAVLPCSTA